MQSQLITALPIVNAMRFLYSCIEVCPPTKS